MKVRIHFLESPIWTIPHTPPTNEERELDKSVREKVKRIDLHFDFTPQIGMQIEVLDFSNDFHFSPQEIDAMKPKLFEIRNIVIRKRHLEVYL